MCCYLKKKFGLTPRFNERKMVTPPGGVHCVSSESAKKAYYLLTHFDRFQALIIINTRSTGVVDTACEVWLS